MYFFLIDNVLSRYRTDLKTRGLFEIKQIMITGKHFKSSYFKKNEGNRLISIDSVNKYTKMIFKITIFSCSLFKLCTFH